MTVRRLNDATPEEWDEAYNKIIENYFYDDDNSDKILKAVDTQVGGNHYKKFKIQPAEFCYKNNIPYLEATAIKYLCRWKDKGGIQDLEKAKHFIDLLIEFQDANN